MDVEKNIISSDVKLSAIAGVMFFAPFVKNRVKSNSLFDESDRNFIAWYLKIWYLNIVFLIIVLICSCLNLFLTDRVLSQVITFGSIAIFIISVFSIFSCVNDLPMWSERESIMQKIPNKLQILKVYMPIMNFVLRSRQENYNMPYRWMKESVLLRTFFIFWTLLLWNSFWIGVLIIIAIRIILLMINIDIIPFSMKKVINSSFLCNPWEVFAYIFAPINSKLKNLNYETILQAMKQGYMQWQNLWIWIVIQYVLFVGILFLLYRWISFSWENLILFIAMFLRIIRGVIFYMKRKKILKIPILSEIISLIFR